MHCNIRGWISHKDELHGHIVQSDCPSLIVLNETLLDESVENPQVNGYQLVGRHESASTRRGIAAFAKDSFASDVVLLEKSSVTERMWLIVHSQLGAILLCVWYRRPNPGEVESITSLRQEYLKNRPGTIGTILVGDLNIHHIRWLKFSARNSPEGDALLNFCREFGFEQLVQSPTRDSYLLDLVLTDLQLHPKVVVKPGISDHSIVTASFTTCIPVQEVSERTVWKYQEANWTAMRNELSSYSWPWSPDTDPDLAAEEFGSVLLDLMERHIPHEVVQRRSGSHPWFNDRCMDAVRAKQAAWGTSLQRETSEKCSAILFEQYMAYVAVVRAKLAKLKRGSRQWWKISKGLMHKSTSACGIPALKSSSGNWVRSNSEKADLLADCFQQKWMLPPAEPNFYSYIGSPDIANNALLPIRSRHVKPFLAKLDVNSANGPDGVSSRVLRMLSDSLAVPFAKLARCIVECGRWPTLWTVHWICALHKKKSQADPNNYRGLQLTAQISKAMERYLASLFLPSLISLGGFGANQFAYKPGHGSRDAVLFAVTSWLLALSQGFRVGVYCSDVSGAFDKVPASRLVRRLSQWKIHPKILEVLQSWLRPRRARVIVGGATSQEFLMSDMVYQGTVWGPSLWNTFFADAARALQCLSFHDLFYADDLNAFKLFEQHVSDQSIMNDLGQGQRELHMWGAANQVTFDPGKESFHILSRAHPLGDSFRILGLTFDCKLLMHEAIDECATACGWKLESIMRTRRFFTNAELVLFFKSHLLSFIEYRTPGIYHAAPSCLKALDSVLPRFLRQLCISDIDALLHFGLAPLHTRRDIAMLGVIHRAGLDSGPVQLRQFFKLAGSTSGRFRHRHSRHMLDPCDTRNCQNFLSRSVLGLVGVYNALPEYVVACRSVSSFQAKLQDLVKYLATTGYSEWKTCLNRSSLARTILPRISEEVVRRQGELLPIPRLQSR